MSPDRSTEEALAPPVGASVWESDLFEHLVGHVSREGSLLRGYAEAGASSGSKAFAYVVDLLCEDERRHHRMFEELARSLRAEAELSDADPPVPHLDFRSGDPRRIRDLTEQLLRSEKEDAADLRRLRRKMHDVRDTTLWTLLVDTMQRDTDKHIALLEFVLRHTPGT